MTSGISTIDGQTTQALQTALGAEHAAVWCYTLAVAFLVEPQLSQARRDADVHRELRGRIEQTLSEIGQRPVSAQPAYATPRPVTDAASAAALAVVAETDCLTAWRAVLEQTTDKSLRQAGLQALTDATLRCAGWRTVVGVTPAIPPFPGRP
ncbi:MAG TPA: ferritin-like domain-containing protein [Pseudonocardia sp.]